MSLSVQTDVHCDGCSAWTEGPETHPTKALAREVRHAAKLKGWVYRDGRDLCPYCASGHYRTNDVPESSGPPPDTGETRAR